jgi:CheY-like chemotaxis protein
MSEKNSQPKDVGELGERGEAVFSVRPIRSAELLLLLAGSAEGTGESSSNTPAVPVKILIAEDSEDNRFLVEVYLGDQPYDLRFAENGQDALNRFETEEFDLVLMDIQMPVMDGLMATQLMRAYERRSAGAHTPILALTGNARLGDAEKSEAAGCDGHLSKPISKEELISAIENFRFAAHAGR